MDRDQVPEVVVLLKANQCQLFKDISIDGEVSCHEKCCVENCELDHNNISSLLKYELAKTSTDVSEQVLLYISTGVQESFSSNHDCLKDDIKLSGAAHQNKLMENKASFGGSTADIANVNSSKNEFSKTQNVATTAQISNFSLLQLFNTDDDHGDEQQNHQDPIRETIPTFPRFSAKEGDCSISNAVHSRLETDMGAESINDHTYSPLIKNEDKSAKFSGVEQSPEDENMYDNGVNTSKKPLLSSSFSYQNALGVADNGSSSFSAASTPSGRLTFSGSMICSDNISLRSNSTTSTTSFAFPILASEWNESPIRMTEVDRNRRRRFRKCTCWRMCFTCSSSCKSCSS